MTTLHERLSDLADEAPPGAPSADLWSTGRRLHRRRRLGSGAVVATVVALVVGLAGLRWQRADVDVQPAGPEAELGMPDRVYLPSERLPGTDDVGPIGPLSAVMSGMERLTGISGTGEYAYLDLPGWRRAGEEIDVSAEASLSDDGTRLAYFGSGRTSGEPIYDNPLVSVRVYDTVSGEVATYQVPTEHGLQPELLLWADDLLWFEIWQYDAPQGDGGRSASLVQTVAWNPTTDERTSWDGRPENVPPFPSSTWRDALVTVGSQGVLRLTTTQGSTVRARLSETPVRASDVMLDDSGTRAVALGDIDAREETSSDLATLLVGDLPAPGDTSTKVSMREVPGTGPADRPVYELLGWRDDSHVVVLRYGEKDPIGVVSVDVETGGMERLGTWDANVPSFAAGALRGPVFDAPRPPEPMNPLLVYGGIAAILVAGGAVLLWWRRRVQR